MYNKKNKNKILHNYLIQILLAKTNIIIFFELKNNKLINNKKIKMIQLIY